MTNLDVNFSGVIFVPHKMTQLESQLAHMASCEWQEGDSEFMQEKFSITHNSPRERVVTQIVPLYVTPT